MIPQEQYIDENITSLELLQRIRKQREQQQQHQNNYNNTHGAGRSMTPEDCEAVKEAYMANISDTMTGAVAAMIEKAFSRGLTQAEVIMAIEETGFAPRPSPQYLRKILENWCDSGVTFCRSRGINRTNKAAPWWK